jgi:hypothetical protein
VNNLGFGEGAYQAQCQKPISWETNMNLSGFVVRIVFLALPGLIGFIIYRKLRGRPRRQTWEDLIQVLLFSLASYVVLGVFLLIHWPSSLDAFCDETKPLNFVEIGLASVIGIFLGFLASLVHKREWLPRIGIRLHVSSRTGDEDLWHSFHNMPNPWIIVRDHDHNLVYYGSVMVFSESDKDRELIMQDVTVYADGDNGIVELYDTPALYIARDKNSISLELPPPVVKNNISEEIPNGSGQQSAQHK